MSIWDEFDEQVDVEGLKADAKAAADNKQDFKEVPVGDYEVAIEKLELVKSAKDRPMVSVWFSILSGDYKGQKIFMNQVIDIGFGLHNAKEFLKSLDTTQEIDFESYAQFGALLETVKTEADECEFALKFTKNKKDYNEFEITDIFEKE